MLEIYFKGKLRCKNERKVEMDRLVNAIDENKTQKQSICADRIDGHTEIGHTTL